MKKKLIIFLFIFVSNFCVSQDSKINISEKSEEKTIDARFVGKWEGSEKDQQIKGFTKKWRMIRNNDGTFILYFESIKNKKTTKFSEKGNWYILNNRFYEFHESSGQTDIYDFEILTPDSIKFSMVYSDLEMDNPEYTFIDNRIKKVK